jgi:nucleotide-binding universal stress UspA family protein
LSVEVAVMKHFRKLGVYLNDEPGDKEALAFARLLVGVEQPESIHCIHVRGIEDPAATQAPEPETVRRHLLEVLPPDLVRSIQVHVSIATGLQEILRTARDCDLDMMVVGRRLPHDQMGMGAAFYRLARRSPCDLLVVPDGARPHLNRLLVLIDGSEYSRMALQTALDISRASGEKAQVVAQSVYGVGYGYQYTGKSIEDAGRELEAITRKRVEESIATVDTRGVDFEVVCMCSQNAAAAACDLASARNMDAIVIGSRGPTLPAVAVLGETTDRVVQHSSVPVLVVKQKRKTFRFLDAVLEIFRAA